MDKQQVINRSAGQGTASFVEVMNQMRQARLLENLEQQSKNVKDARKILSDLKEIVSNPENILGSPKSKHGEIAEFMDVYFGNAEAVVNGQKAGFSFDGVPRTGPVDYIKNGTNIQSKFYQSPKKTADAIKEHLDKYPDFLKKGGKYVVPEEQTEEVIKRLGKEFKDKIEPSKITYDQSKNAPKTIADERKKISQENKNQNEKINKKSEPSVGDGIKTTVAAAAFEGIIAFSMKVYSKRKEGKHFSEFTSADWKEIGLETVKGVGKGAVRGGAAYILTNYAGMSAPVANGYITAAFGVVSLANQMRMGELAPDDFIVNAEMVCLESAFSVAASLAGQALIPIPVLGAVIGSIVGNMLSSIAKNYLEKKDLELINFHKRQISQAHWKLQGELCQYLEKIDAQMKRYASIEEMMLSEDINEAFTGSIQFCEFAGVDGSEILRTKEDIDKYFLD